MLAFRLHIANKCGIIIAKGSVFMARTSNVFARVEPEVKQEAEEILERLGIPMSNAVGMFLRQVVMQRGIPFEMKLPAEPLDFSKLSKEEIDIELEKGYSEVIDGKAISAKDAFNDMNKKYGI